MPRFAILHDLNDSVTRPVALLIEGDARIRLYPLDGFRGDTVFDGEYMTIEPDGGFVTYRPGMNEYWDYVLLTLSRTYLVGEVGEADVLERVDILELFYKKVVEPQALEPQSYVSLEQEPHISRYRAASPHGFRRQLELAPDVDRDPSRSPGDGVPVAA